MKSNETTLHATTVAVDGKGVLITGPSGAGKSTLAIGLIGRGAGLVADDRTHLEVEKGRVIARAPQTIEGRIEARGVGLIKVPAHPPVPLRLVIDLAQEETERLPYAHVSHVLGIGLPCLHKVDTPHFPDIVMLYVKGNI
ncbi:MAG: HPr kinase/phosphatase C-terminal domain-containing protein [Pseudomonadota bacterium]